MSVYDDMEVIEKKIKGSTTMEELEEGVVLLDEFRKKWIDYTPEESEAW